MESNKKAFDVIAQYFKSRNIPFTAERRLIVNKLLSVKGHISAEELISMLWKEKKKISRPTVYRTLTILRESGLFDAHDFDQRRRVYEVMIGRMHHDHLYCMSCGKIAEFSEEKIERLQDKVVKSHGFTEVYHSHKIFGYCSTCKHHARPRF